ncbi:hypothetical protein [Streptomyces yerevanensis]|uniref:hypothetical protein n=1 Tax=Streptomyces yerevanensis TaxID=66378 RepID=UPI00068B4639|nr:hypothetical protein [Streptomyces yerevanensis]
MTGMPSTPPAAQPDWTGPATSWGAVPPPLPPQPPVQKPSRRKAWLTHGATAFGALIFGAAIGGSGESGSAADSTRPAPAVTVTKTADAPAPEPAVTVTETAKETVTAKPKPTKKPGPPDAINGDGQYLVGEDIQAGTYKTAGPENDNFGLGCYWARNKNASGEFGAIIANDNITGQSRVTVNKGEYFETKGCLKWEKVG